LKLLIFCDDDKLYDYTLFSKALTKFGISATCARSLKYCYISTSKPFSNVPSPKMLNLIKKVQPDAILTDSIYYIPNLAKLVDRFVIIHLRYDVWSEADVDKNTYPHMSSRIFTNYLSTIKETCIKNADLVLLNSQWLQTEFNKHMPEKRNGVLYVGMDPKIWNNQTYLTQKHSLKHPAVAGIFQLGELRKVQGLIKFMKAIQKMPDVNFYFAGDGAYFNLVKKNCPPNMTLLGHISKSEIKTLLEGCDVFVHPAGLDALPRAIREASLLEKPIVASTVGGIPEMVKDNETGYLCEINATDQWVEKIRFLLENPDKARTLGKNARAYVATKFDWENLAASFAETISSLN
jgi:glycosyltransferase involved in cell wall biosynthesis